ncbi:hypothetical protein BJV74DRAFT_799473 [Russula compacta]|nr:hypothetical protein BJV74DRAFT_799473 [Russula compacta]
MLSGLATFGGQRVGMMCEEDHTLHNRVSIFCIFTTDFILLVLMLTGVLRWKGARESGSIWPLLYKQGLAWVVVFTLAEVPPVVFLILNLNCVFSPNIPWLRTHENMPRKTLWICSWA